MKKFMKLAAVFAALVLALSCFVACSNNSDSDEDASKVIAGYTTSETTTDAGNKVSDMLYLIEGGKFELYKNLSYGEYSGFALFAKGSYSGNILENGSLTFKIEEEVDASSLTGDEKTMLGISSSSSSSAKSARSALAARSELGDLIAKLKALVEKLESLERKNVSGEGRSIKIKSDRGGITVTDADGNEQSASASASGVQINLDGFLLTGNPRFDKESMNTDDWEWASTQDGGAIPLEKVSDGKYACSFVADNSDTLIRLILEKWKSQYGLSSIDIEKSTLPEGARITNDKEVVNTDHEEWQDSENIAIAGIEKGRKYDITFDTAKTPGKICIDLKKRVVTTLDGYMVGGMMNAFPNPDRPGEVFWPGTEKEGAIPLKKSGVNTWTCSLPLVEGWNGFRLIKDGWVGELGRSQIASCNDNWFGVGYDPKEDDDNIAFTFYGFKGTETANLTFTVRQDGAIDIHCDMIWD